MKLYEVFKQSYPWQWTYQDSDTWVAKFVGDDGNTVTAEFTEYDGDEWEFEFYRETGESYRTIAGSSKAVSSKISWQGDAFRIFATIREIIDAFTDRIIPELLDFTAPNNDPSRQKLYDRMLPQLAKAVGMDYEIKQKAHDKLYRLSS